MTWLPEWRVSVGDDVYTTATSVSFSSGRLDIDRQPTAGYARIEIINATNSPFTINVTDSVILELKDTSGIYVTVFGGEVSDFSIGVKSPDELGYITTGTILAVGALSRLTKTIYTAALSEGLDGAQIEAILSDALNLTWEEVTPTLTWATYPPTITWENAETYIGTVDPGQYTMISVAAGNYKASNLTDQIANSALGTVYEGKDGNVYYADADARNNYLIANGSIELDGSYASLTTVKSLTQIAKIHNSEVVRYGTDYASTYSAEDMNSIGVYGRYERKYDSNVKNLLDVTDIVTRDLALRATPYAQLDQINFRLDNPSMPDSLRDKLINIFFGQPVVITNLPANMFDGYFDGFIENMTFRASPTSVDVTLYLSPLNFMLVAGEWATATPASIIWNDVNAILTWNKAIGALN